MPSIQPLVAVILLSLSLSAHAETAATVNGTKISDDLLQAYQELSGSDDPTAALDNLINLVVVKQAADESGLLDRPDIAAQVEVQQMSQVARLVIQQWVEEADISDDMLRNEYQRQVGNAGGDPEYKARHILVESKEKAGELIAQLDEGADFAALAREHSTGPSGSDGGDLGWFGAGSMVAPFSEAVAQMEPGSYSAEPVETRFGFHVIKLEDVRESQAPSFESVAPRLREAVTQRVVQQRLSNLLDSADIERNIEVEAQSADE